MPSKGNVKHRSYVSMKQWNEFHQKTHQSLELGNRKEEKSQEGMVLSKIAVVRN